MNENRKQTLFIIIVVIETIKSKMITAVKKKRKRRNRQEKKINLFKSFFLSLVTTKSFFLFALCVFC